MDGPHPLHKLLAAGAPARLTARARQHEGLERRAQAALPEPFAGRLRFGSFHDGILVLVTHSAAWATRARFAIPDLERDLSRVPQFAEMRALRVRVVPAAPPEGEPAGAPPRAAPGISPQTRRLLLDSAAALPEGPIRNALLRLGAAG